MPHVHGFVSGKSHISAAKEHIGAKWVASFDLEDFFPNTQQSLVKQSLKKLGYNAKSANFLCELTCLNARLPQGAPTSPVLSNMCFQDFDEKLALLAMEQNLTFTRYADDLSFSSSDEFDAILAEKVESIFTGSSWKLSESKRKFAQAPARLKIHGLLLKANEVRLTKGYRNRIRAFRHVISTKQLEKKDYRRLMGHINYSSHVEENGSL